MADAWLAGDDDICPWGGSMGMMFGIKAAWPLMLFVSKFVKDGHDVQSVDDPTPALEKLQERLEFLIDKADNERGLSASKAREQVCAYLWLFGRGETISPSLSFSETASHARVLLEEVQAQRAEASI